MATRILLLDDEPAIRELVTRILEAAGYQVDTLTDPLTAIELLQEGRHALIITNSSMHGPGGARFVARLRQLWPELPILHLDDQSHPRTPEFPADVSTLTKPFDHEAVLDTVRTLLDH